MKNHDFEPTVFHRAMGTYEPVLRVGSGDIIRTTTVSADGRDGRNEQVAVSSNPLTGPFFVDGAEPGDTLAVDLLRLAPNRAHGYSSRSLAPSVVEPRHVPDLPDSLGEKGLRVPWHIDEDRGTATLTPTAEHGGRRLVLPLSPMVGCFGVAPARNQAISTATSGEHGGNMDFRGFRAGVTAYFPVFVPGALFFIGDGHALQGDGEIAGTGVEISMEVEFRLRLVKGQTIGWPRGESEDHIFTIGNARPLEQALQHATTEMLRWLQDDQGLTSTMANTLMGQAVEYAIANVFNPAYSIACMMPKRWLSEPA